MDQEGWPWHWAPVDRPTGWLGEGVIVEDGSESGADDELEREEMRRVKNVGVLAPCTRSLMPPPVRTRDRPDADFEVAGTGDRAAQQLNEGIEVVQAKILPDPLVEVVEINDAPLVPPHSARVTKQTNQPTNFAKTRQEQQSEEWFGLDDIEVDEMEEIVAAAEDVLNSSQKTKEGEAVIELDLKSDQHGKNLVGAFDAAASKNEENASPEKKQLTYPKKRIPTKAGKLVLDDSPASAALDKKATVAITVQLKPRRIPLSSRFSSLPTSVRTKGQGAQAKMWRPSFRPLAERIAPDEVADTAQPNDCQKQADVRENGSNMKDLQTLENQAFLGSSPAQSGKSADLIAQFLAEVASEVDGRAVHVEKIPAAPAKLVAMSAIPLSPIVCNVLAKNGRSKTLYTHQAQAIQAVFSGKNVVVATPTASGKSTCFVAPVLEMLLNSDSKKESGGRALLMFPLKALAQDQLQKLQSYVADAKPRNPIAIASYDGDTPTKERAEIRRKAAVVLTNPDMVHTALLRNHNLWAHFFQQLRYVVLDESHSYCGVFGAHVSCIVKRLRTVCQYYNSNPRFILCSATIADPREHAMSLTGLDFALIGPEDNGAPRGTRTMLFWQPKAVDELAPESGRLTSAECSQILAKLMSVGLRTVAFLRSRKATEMLCNRTKELLEKQNLSELTDRIESYRGGYASAERREIEHRLFSGKLMAVTSTSALELGVDVGGLDATLLQGFPDSIASLWQQAGRSGRGGQPCLTIMIGTDEVLDQYYIKHPKDLLSAKFEPATLDPENPYVLRSHLQRALKEHPLSSGQVAREYGTGAIKILEELEFRQLVKKSGTGDLDCWEFIGPQTPEFSIRDAIDEKYLLTHKQTGEVVEEISLSSAASECHKGAVYLHRGVPHLVIKVDHESRVSTVIVPNNISFYTIAEATIEVDMQEAHEHWEVKRAALCLGIVSVTKEVTSYRKFNLETDQRIGSTFETSFPSYTYSTTGLWFTVSAVVFDEFCSRFHMDPSNFPDSLSGMATICARVVPLTALCSRVDVGGVSFGSRTFLAQDPVLDNPPTVILYDSNEGGNGVCKALRNRVEHLWELAHEVVHKCPCDDGCPSCVMRRGSEWHKEGTKILLECLMDCTK